MGRDAKIGRATRRARWIAQFRAEGGQTLTDPAAIEQMLPRETIAVLAPVRHRTLRRIVERALNVPRKPAGPVFVGRRDSRWQAPIDESEKAYNPVLADLKQRGYRLGE